MNFRTIAGKIKRRISKRELLDKALPAAEKKRLLKTPRFTGMSIKLFGRDFKVTDAQTFIGSYQEIFKDEIYKFYTSKTTITIIDCGANIGLSTLYFKINYPDAQIIAFEPDPNIFAALQYNMTSFGYNDVICKNEAISNCEASMRFWLEGGHSGMLVDDNSDKKSALVNVVRLKDLLKRLDQVTFLKIDIEGEEANVMPDIAKELHKVDYLFLEYHSFVDVNQNLDSLLNIITKAGMRYYVESAITKQVPFINEEIFLNMDMLLNIFCYRDLN